MTIKHLSVKALFPTVILMLLGAQVPGSAEPNTDATVSESNDLTALSLEQLSSMEVTSVSRLPQKESTAAAAVYVITAEDIRRFGATSIVDALRLAPGVDVARINSNQWSVGIRGFSNRLSREMLVLMDGRSVYSPLFHGTYWEMQDTLLEDIDRIEVIRGPGGTLWGANAVNGVINIITKNSKNTQGTYLMAGAGSQENAFGGLRYGGAKGPNFHYRLYGKYFDRDPQFSNTGDEFDAWHMGQGGFRTDWDIDASNTLTTQGDIYNGKQGERAAFPSYTPPTLIIFERDANVFGANLLSRWKHTLANGSDTALQAYYDRTERKDPTFLEYRNTYDIDFQHHIALNLRDDLIWGMQYRITSNRTEGVPNFIFDPNRRTDQLFSWFIQNTFMVIPNILNLTLGSKFEHNDYSGWEIQPNGRAAWTPDERQTVWAAVSRAVRTPSALEQDIIDTLAPGSAASTTFPRLVGNKDFRSEEVIAYELGYRVQPVDPLFLDLAGFYNQYDRLVSFEQGTPFAEITPGVPHTIIPYTFGNALAGHTQGFEFVSTYFVNPNWRLRSTYSLLTTHLTAEAGSSDTSSVRSIEGSSPQHQVLLQSLMSLPYGFELDPTARYVDVLKGSNIPSYWSCDLHLGWHATKHLVLALVGQNLLQTKHRESGTLQQIERSVYGQVSYRTW